MRLDHFGVPRDEVVTNLVGELVALGLENIMLRVFSFNERAIRVYEKVGFQEIGRRRSAFRLAGQAHDVVFMDFLAADFASSVLRRILTEDSDEAT